LPFWEEDEEEEGGGVVVVGGTGRKSGGEGMVGNRGFCGAAIYTASTMTAGGGGLAFASASERLTRGPTDCWAPRVSERKEETRGAAWTGSLGPEWKGGG